MASAYEGSRTRLHTCFARLTSLKGWEIHPEPSTYASNPNYSNKVCLKANDERPCSLTCSIFPNILPNGWQDMDPTPPDQRVWTMFSFISLWISDAFNIPTWELASASISIGLGWRQALPAVAIGHLVIALVITFNGTIGARLHVPFPVLNRSSFGFWFSYFTVISR